MYICLTEKLSYCLALGENVEIKRKREIEMEKYTANCMVV